MIDDARTPSSSHTCCASFKCPLNNIWQGHDIKCTVYESRYSRNIVPGKLTYVEHAHGGAEVLVTRFVILRQIKTSLQLF